MVPVQSIRRPGLDGRFSYRGENVVATLDRVCSEVPFPRTLQVDQGSEIVPRVLDLWAYAPPELHYHRRSSA